MEILYVCSSSDFLTGSFAMASYLARKTDSVLVGVIFESLDWEEIPLAYSGAFPDAIGYTVSTALPENDDVRARAEAQVQRFRDACIAAEVKHKVHIDRNRPLRELIAESRYADLIILSAGLSPDNKDKKTPTDFVMRALEKAECPLIVASEHFEKISQLIFAYDGSLDATYAIKQFSYLFPQFRHTPIVLVEVLSDSQEGITEKHKLHEWLGMHYSDVSLVALEGEQAVKLLEYLNSVHDAMVVIGGFGRGALSKIFTRSISEPIVRMIDLPLFIAHVPE